MSEGSPYANSLFVNFICIGMQFRGMFLMVYNKIQSFIISIKSFYCGEKLCCFLLDC